MADSPKQKVSPERKRMREIVKRFQHYVATYSDQQFFDTYQDRTFILDMLFGIGLAVDPDQFSGSEGFARFHDVLAKEYVSQSLVCYWPCVKHQCMGFTMTVGAPMRAPKTVCPICEPPK